MENIALKLQRKFSRVWLNCYGTWEEGRHEGALNSANFSFLQKSGVFPRKNTETPWKLGRKLYFGIITITSPSFGLSTLSCKIFLITSLFLKFGFKIV